ncbi:MAG: WG repeat-containing protein [Clostridia bacterium]|nr:WG repeat-containing protein [Clostridia bacterium]
MEQFILAKNGDILDIRTPQGVKIATVNNVYEFRKFYYGYMAVCFITKRYADTGKPAELRWGFIDTKGNIVVEPKYVFVSNVNKLGNAFVQYGQFGGEVIKVEK